MNTPRSNWNLVWAWFVCGLLDHVPITTITRADYSGAGRYNNTAGYTECRRCGVLLSEWGQ